jgi:hypothetical protein
MGTRAAENIFQQILFEQFGIPTALRDWPKYPSMIGLAVGKKAVVYDPEGGTRCSEDLMKVYFGDDLAFKRKLCWVSDEANGRLDGELTRFSLQSAGIIRSLMKHGELRVDSMKVLLKPKCDTLVGYSGPPAVPSRRRTLRGQ